VGATSGKDGDVERGCCKRNKKGEVSKQILNNGAYFYFNQCNIYGLLNGSNNMCIL